MKLVYKLFVILQNLLLTVQCIYIFRKVSLTNVHYFNNNVTVFIDSIMNVNYIN